MECSFVLILKRVKIFLSEHVGARLKICERVENLPGAPDKGRRGGKFSLRASLNFDVRKPMSEERFLPNSISKLFVNTLQ